MADTDKFIHIEIEITYNEDTWQYADPKVRQSVRFYIPEFMFDAKKLAEHIANKIDEAKKQFPAAVIETAKRRAEEEAKEKAKAEASV